ncbi:unnamed protein product, partial [Ectocarpus sp. 12 AP-2014]
LLPPVRLRAPAHGHTPTEGFLACQLFSRYCVTGCAALCAIAICVGTTTQGVAQRACEMASIATRTWSQLGREAQACGHIQPQRQPKQCSFR